MAISIPDADALGDSIQGGIDAGIPMVSLDSGSDVAAELGMLTHVGQTEYEAGVGAGQRMGEAGVTTALCVNQEVGNVAQADSCRGVDRIKKLPIKHFTTMLQPGPPIDQHNSGVDLM